MNTSKKTDSYRPDIDGLRSVAVVSVILFHANLGCPGGFVGVDIFFVISGYLITKIIERDLLQRRFSVMKFYQRRIRRIFPALFAMLLACSVAGLVWLPPAELQDLGKCIVATSAFVSNILFFRRSGYFATASLNLPLLHTWTLSVEEQFYIFWPWILAIMSLGIVSKWKPWLVVSILTGSLLLSSYWLIYQPQSAFYMLPSRAWELAIGAIITIAPFPSLLQKVPRRVADVISVLGLGMIIAAIAAYNSLVPFPGFAALLPCAGAALLIASSEASLSLGGRFLSLPPLVWTGLISYSLYLWHWPILVFAGVFFNGQMSLSARIACVAFIPVVSWLSWRYVETPFRDPQFLAGRSRTWVLCGLGTTAIFIMIGFAFVRSDGMSGRAPEVARWVALQQRDADTQLVTSPCLGWGATLPPTNNCLLGVTNPESEYSVALWGDSNAAHLAPAFKDIGFHLGITSREIAKAGCPPLPGIRFVPESRMTRDCPTFNELALKTILADKNIKVVVLAARWISLADGIRAATLNGHMQDSRASRQLFIDSLHKTVEALISSGRQVIFVGQVPIPVQNPITCLARVRFNHWNESPCLSMPATHAGEQEIEVNTLLSAVGGAKSSVQMVHPYDQLCVRERCQLVSNGIPLYWDDDHLSSAGAKVIEEAIQASIVSSLQAAYTKQRDVLSMTGSGLRTHATAPAPRKQTANWRWKSDDELLPVFFGNIKEAL